MDLFQTIIIAIVEGLTEFLPVSSTGHMIITQNLLGVQQGDPFVHAFTSLVPSSPLSVSIGSISSRCATRRSLMRR